MVVRAEVEGVDLRASECHVVAHDVDARERLVGIGVGGCWFIITQVSDLGFKRL